MYEVLYFHTISLNHYATTIQANDPLYPPRANLFTNPAPYVGSAAFWPLLMSPSSRYLSRFSVVPGYQLLNYPNIDTAKKIVTQYQRVNAVFQQ